MIKPSRVSERHPLPGFVRASRLAADRKQGSVWFGPLLKGLLSNAMPARQVADGLSVAQRRPGGPSQLIDRQQRILALGNQRENPADAIT